MLPEQSLKFLTIVRVPIAFVVMNDLDHAWRHSSGSELLINRI